MPPKHSGAQRPEKQGGDPGGPPQLIATVTGRSKHRGQRDPRTNTGVVYKAARGFNRKRNQAGITRPAERGDERCVTPRSCIGAVVQTQTDPARVHARTWPTSSESRLSVNPRRFQTSWGRAASQSPKPEVTAFWNQND